MYYNQRLPAPLAKFDNFDVDDLKLRVDRTAYGIEGILKAAFEDTQTIFFSDSRVVRPYATKALVVLSGEFISELASAIRRASKPLLLGGVRITSVAVGDDPDVDLPEVFTSGPEFIFEFSEVSQLPVLVSQVYEAILKGMRAIPTPFVVVCS